MLFLDDFLEMLEELPNELRERCYEIREIDLDITAAFERNRGAIREFFEKAAGMPAEQQATRLKELQAEYTRLRSRSEEKVALAERMQELLEKYTQHLEKEKMHFKYELEADNPGVTEAIEKRFSDYVEQQLAMRKERRKRHHTSTSSHGGGQGGGDEPSSSRAMLNGTAMPARGGPPLSKSARLDVMSFDESPVASPTLNSLVRAGPGRKSLNVEENVIRDARREAIRAQLQASLSLKGSSPVGRAATPGADASRSDRWTPSAVGGGTPSSSHSPSSTRDHPSFTYPTISTTTPTAVAPSTPSPASSAMPNFSGLESRHGRPRKLTSRVQEMFNSASLMPHRERTPRHTQPSTYAPPSSHVESPSPSAHPSYRVSKRNGPLSDENDDEGDEETSDERPWCFCNEKSYGHMVACDNKECPYEWFHMPCVGLDVPPRGKWFCPSCSGTA